VTLQSGTVPADRDFVLEWRANPSAVPEAAIFAEEIDGSSHLMVMLLPPSAEAAAPETGQAPGGGQPRDMIFIIDSSGSMHGPSMEQAKGAVLAALDRLKPDDRFNVIHFNNTAYALFERAEPASDGNLMKAWYYVKALSAEGGTNMRPALEMALDEPAEAGRLRQVVFVTDGAVGNEAALFTLINRRLGSARLFTVGIGSAPNSYFMRKAAESGRGSFVYIGDSQEVGKRMSALFRKLESPALTGIKVAWQLPNGRLPEVYPQPLPDLYAGEPVVMTARLQGLALDELAGALVITGESGGAAWERRLSLEGPGAAPGIAALWARAKLDQIEDGLHLGERPDMVRAKALEVALEHGLVSHYTSLVAIDDVIARPKGAGMESTEIARNLPAGWSYEHVFGEAAKHMRLRSLPAPLLKKTGDQSIGLPQGASPARFQLILGSAAVLVALLLVMLAGRFSRPRAAYTKG
jgi:Ca-activated chloride channel family protein